MTAGTVATGRHAGTDDTAGTPDGPRTGVVWWVVLVLSWTVALAALAVIAVAVVVPRIAGATPYTVLTSSMEPTYPPGTLVVTRPVGDDPVGVGTVVTYQLASGESEVVTHRVVAVSRGLDGSVRYTTQGDANPGPDAEKVRQVQIRGEVWYAVPQLGRVNTLLTGQQHQLVVYGVAGLLIAYAGSRFLVAARDRRARTTTARSTGTTSAGPDDDRSGDH